MDKLLRLNRSRTAVWAFGGLLFLFLFLLNCLTPYVADDYVYMFSFADKTRLDSLGAVLQSMTHSR